MLLFNFEINFEFEMKKGSRVENYDKLDTSILELLKIGENVEAE